MLTKVKSIKARVAAGTIAVGVNIQTDAPEMVEMAGLAGYHYVMIDWEHGSYGTGSVVNMIRAADAVGIPSVVRVPGHEDVWIKRVLDAGAHGVVVPHITHADQARRVVASARYPEGQNGGARGVCPSVRAAGHLARDWEGFSRACNRDVYVAISIESRGGVAAIASIADVPGIDAIFLGTFDLSHEMGHFSNTTHPEVQSQISLVTQEAGRRGIPIHATLLSSDGEKVAAEIDRWIAQGAFIFNSISDRRLIMVGLRERLAYFEDIIGSN